MKINLPMRNLTGPFTLTGTTPDGGKFSNASSELGPLITQAFKLNLTNWQIKGQQEKRRRILLEDTK